MEADVPPHEFVPAEKLGVSFKLKHHEHYFTATVAGVQDFALDGGGTTKVLAVCLPARMQRLQRRVFHRVDVPGNRSCGPPTGWAPAAAAQRRSDATPVWSGRVVNVAPAGSNCPAAPRPCRCWTWAIPWA